MNSIPVPMWLHEVGANNWYLNDEYNKRFHVGRKEFWSPVNIFRFYPAKVSAGYVANDMAVLESNVSRVFDEWVSNRVMDPKSDSNPQIKHTVVKVPIQAGGRRYILGMCEEKTNETLLKHWVKQSKPNEIETVSKKFEKGTNS